MAAIKLEITSVHDISVVLVPELTPSSVCVCACYLLGTRAGPMAEPDSSWEAAPGSINAGKRRAPGATQVCSTTLSRVPFCSTLKQYDTFL